MRTWIVLCLLPLSCAFGALLGGYSAVDIDDPIVQSKLRSVLESDRNLGSLPIKRVFQQKLAKVTNYEVYQGIPNNMGKELCKRITCQISGDCTAPVPCTKKDSPLLVKPERKAILLGGYEPASLEDAQDAIDFVMEKMNSMSNSMFRFVTEDVTSLTKQVIAGYRYNFTISLVSTSCRNNHKNRGKQLGDCEVTDRPERQRCHVIVLHTLVNGHWEYSLESHRCDPIVKASGSHKLSKEEYARCKVYFDDFQQFKKDYQRGYSSMEEENYRFETFCVNMRRIEKMREIEQGSAVYGVNKFADMSEEEFRMYYLGTKWNLTPPSWMTSAEPVNLKEKDVPDSFDWRDKGAVTPVKNQGYCGSCWAFSTTGNIEGQWAIRSKKLVSLSEQELVDCDKLDDGCEGGLPSNAYEAIMKLGGLETENEYKYSGRDEKCKFNRSEVAVKINGGLNISSDETEMKAWLFKNGPISIGINANAMQFYFGGISHPWRIFCNPNNLDHGVLIVGYGVSSSNEPYWIIKNSWGADWGEKGYYLVYRGKGVCGLNKMCTSAKIN